MKKDQVECVEQHLSLRYPPGAIGGELPRTCVPYCRGRAGIGVFAFAWDADEGNHGVEVADEIVQIDVKRLPWPFTERVMFRI